MCARRIATQPFFCCSADADADADAGGFQDATPCALPKKLHACRCSIWLVVVSVTTFVVDIASCFKTLPCSMTATILLLLFAPYSLTHSLHPTAVTALHSSRFLSFLAQFRLSGPSRADRRTTATTRTARGTSRTASDGGTMTTPTASSIPTTACEPPLSCLVCPQYSQVDGRVIFFV